jgi:hypothetical protein
VPVAVGGVRCRSPAACEENKPWRKSLVETHEVGILLEHGRAAEKTRSDFGQQDVEMLRQFIGGYSFGVDIGKELTRSDKFHSDEMPELRQSGGASMLRRSLSGLPSTAANG